MLGKSLKYEFKSTARIFALLYLALIVLAGVSRLTSVLFSKIPIVSDLSGTFYGIILVGTIVVTFLLIIQRFYKCLLGNEGYLTMTLPVKPHIHILSKGITAIVWVILTVAVALISIIILIPDYNIFNEIKAGITVGGQVLKANIGMSAGTLFALLIVTLLSAIIYQISILYASMSIGQLATKNKVVFSVVAYIAIYMVVQFVAMLPIMLLLTQGLFGDISLFSANEAVVTDALLANLPQFVSLTFTTTILSSLVLSVVFFFATHYLIKNKLNLE